MVVRAPQSDIKKASDEELGYLAGLIDGEGALGIKDYQPRIIVKMKNIEPLKLAEKYGIYWYVDCSKNYRSIYYSWYIQGSPLIDHFIERLMPHSRAKKVQFALLLMALQIRKAEKLGWANEIARIDEQLKKLHKANPVVTSEAAHLLDKKRPGWREWVPPDTKIESESPQQE
jgi:hypothetical protein